MTRTAVLMTDAGANREGGSDSKRGMRLQGDERWFAVHTRVHQEKTAAFQLRRQGFPVFLPQRLKSRRHARKIDTVKAAFFPRYLFVILDLQRDAWRAVNSTIGVSSLIMDGHSPRPVPVGVVEELLERADARGVLSFSADYSLCAGQSAEILAGPFADQIGTLQRLSDDGRVRMLLEIMGGRISVDLPKRALRPVG